MFNNVRSNNILKKIFQNIRKKAKLNILKYNKKILERLTITKEDFESCEELKKFNQKYKLDIKHFETEILALNHRNIDNEGLECMSKIKFNELRELYFYWSQISDINALNKMRLEKLITLVISSSEISNLDIL